MLISDKYKIWNEIFKIKMKNLMPETKSQYFGDFG